MKNKLRFILITFLFAVNGILSFAQAVTAVINVSDYQWLDDNNNPINFATRFPGTSLTRYYAPHPVFFQGWQSSPREAIVDYKWDFGDNSPVFHGFNAGHVYEIPGIYTATLTVTDTLRNLNSATIAIEVLARDKATYYVNSQLGNDSYDGKSQIYTGQNHGPWKTANKVFSEMATTLYQPGDRILFNRGQTFDLSVTEITPGAWPTWGYMIGAYGSGAKPIIQYSGANNAIIIHQYSIGLAHVSFVDLDFRFNDYAGHRAGTFFFAQGGGTRNLLFLRVDALDLYSDFFVIGHYLERELGTGTFILNSSIRNTLIDPLLNVTLFALWASRFVCLDNTFDFSGNHIGYTAIDKGVIAGNTFSRPAFGRTALRICGFQEEGESWNPDVTSNNVQISNNTFNGWIDPETVGNTHNGGGNRYNYLLVQLAPNGPWNQIIKDITFERNIITNAEGMINIGAAENIIVRNNILISNNSTPSSSFIGIIDANKPCKNIKIIGNSFVSRNAQYSGNIYEMNGLIRVLSNVTQVTHPFGYTNHQNISIKNNVFYINGTNSLTRFLYVDNISEVLPQVKSNNNLFYVSQGSNSGQFFQIGDAALQPSTVQYFTLAQWQTQTGQDLSSIYANPQFDNLLGPDGSFSEFGFDADLGLPQYSPARGVGNVDKVNSHFDFNMQERLCEDNTIDIGAMEYLVGLGVDKKTVKSKDCNLAQNYPNPFNPTTTINYQLTMDNVAKLIIYNNKCELVKVLVDGMQRAGNHSVNFDAKCLNSGVYFYKLEADGKSMVKKMILCK